MTDRELLLQLLDRFGLSPSDAKVGDAPGERSENDVVLQAKHGGVGGYYGFFAEFEFDDDGKFQQVGIWE